MREGSWPVTPKLSTCTCAEGLPDLSPEQNAATGFLSKQHMGTGSWAYESTETHGPPCLKNFEGRQQPRTMKQRQRPAVSQSELPLWRTARMVLFPLGQVSSWRGAGLGPHCRYLIREGEDERTSASSTRLQNILQGA